MMNYTEKIQEAAKRLLAEGKVDVVIGYRRGTVPMMNEPIQIRRAEQADQLYWDSFCGVNLANYLPKRTERIAIVAKGCDSRNIVVHLQEGQIKRDQLVILGAPCQGHAGPPQGLGWAGGAGTLGGPGGKGSGPGGGKWV